MNYYNEIDPFAADWLCQLINAGHIAPGVVDTRSIEDIAPYELREFTQCHFFAGIGVWSYALRQAGWPDDRPVWTGSCPCQPFSAAGKGRGFTDERHLWPVFFHLIEQCRPVTIFGEQVASKDGLTWLDLVQTDLEGAGHTVGAVDSCAAGFGAPHLRQRLFWVADSEGNRLEGFQKTRQRWIKLDVSSPIGGVADANNTGSQGRIVGRSGTGEFIFRPDCLELQEQPGPINGFWGTADRLFCRDEKWRAVEPGTFPLADGATNRVGRLRGYGNAIVAPQAQAFIEAFMETQND